MEFNKNTELEPETLAPLALAYLGDAVYELYIREMLLQKGIVLVNNLHKKTVNFVRASAQANILHQVEHKLTEEELRIVKKGRNTKSNVPRNADMVDYRYSTGFEALVGYLYLKGDKNRFQELFLEAIEKIIEI